jgi:hypothetical protein
MEMKLSSFIYEEPNPFSEKRELNWRSIKIIGVVGGSVCIIGLLCIPSKESPINSAVENTPSRTISTIEQEDVRFIDSSLNSAGYSSRDSRVDSKPKNSEMILRRAGQDFVSSVQPGRKFRARLLSGVTIGQNSMPVIAIATEDLDMNGSIAIPKGSEVFGEASFNSDLERAQITWNSVKLPSGRQRAIAAVSIGLDAKEGVEGKVHTNSTSNIVGQTLSRFVGSYAEGSMEKTAFNGNRGGHVNGLRNAVSETAKDRADRYADNLKKERSWIELGLNREFFILLNQPFVFRDPGGMN